MHSKTPVKPFNDHRHFSFNAPAPKPSQRASAQSGHEATSKPDQLRVHMELHAEGRPHHGQHAGRTLLVGGGEDAQVPTINHPLLVLDVQAVDSDFVHSLHLPQDNPSPCGDNFRAAKCLLQSIEVGAVLGAGGTRSSDGWALEDSLDGVVSNDARAVNVHLQQGCALTEAVGCPSVAPDLRHEELWWRGSNWTQLRPSRSTGMPIHTLGTQLWRYSGSSDDTSNRVMLWSDRPAAPPVHFS